MRNKILLGAGLSACALAWAAKDPVIMTVNGIDVPRSEFEYLFHKNSQQQLTPQPLEEYADMFKVYKLKVADALAAGIDTTAKFRKEMAQYRRELAQPYLTDSVFINTLVAEAAERGQQEVETSHIMLFKRPSAKENRVLRQRMDSIRQAIVDGADFGEMAAKFSGDVGSSKRQGSLGWLVANRFPYTFEIAAYNTPEGVLSEVIESPMGYHIIKTGKRRPASGKVHASHIMKMVRPDATGADQILAKHAIDSLYAVVKADPSKFAEVARASSDDPGSAQKGGELPWFGPGEMVPEFEQAAFALADGEISEPVKSQYGWHIIMKDGTKGAPTADELRPELLRRFGVPQDGRDVVIRKHNMDKLASKHKGRINGKTAARLKELVAANGIDSVFKASLTSDPVKSMVLVEIGKNSAPVSEFAGMVMPVVESDPVSASEILDKLMDDFFMARLENAEEDWLYANNADYRNLLNEYHDGSLLYEISVEKVWDKAAKDTDGLERYFQDHKSNYSWTAPHVKGILVQAKGDSIAELVRKRMNEIPSDSVLVKCRKEFRGKASLEKILVEKGSNSLVDYLVFEGPEVKPANSQYTSFFIYEPKIIMSPESAADVKAQVTGDYQTELETKWINELKAAYPVKVNKKELKKVK